MWAVWLYPGRKSRAFYFSLKALVQDCVQPAKPHKMLSIFRQCVWNSLSYSGVKLASIMLELLVGNLKIHSETQDLFTEVTSCEERLKIMRLSTLKPLTYEELGLKIIKVPWLMEDTDFDQLKYVNAVFWSNWLWDMLQGREYYHILDMDMGDNGLVVFKELTKLFNAC